MERVTVRTRSFSQTLYRLAAAGCDAVEISVVEHALKMEGIAPNDERLTFHVWSRDAEDTEAEIGKGERKLTGDEIKWLDEAKCPICEDHKQLYKGERKGLAIVVSCDEGHVFWVPIMPWVPEFLGQQKVEEAELAQEIAEELIEEAPEEPLEEAAEQLEEAIEQQEEK